MKVSIVIPTYNRHALLRQAVADARALDWPDFEIVVVDQTDTGGAGVPPGLEGDRLRYVHHRPPSQVGATNRGVAVARGEIVLLLDDDARMHDRQLIAAHVENYVDPTIGGVAGRILDAERPVDGPFDPRSQDPVWGFFHSGWTHATRCEVTTAPAANLSFRREVLLAVGGGDERFAGNAFRWENDLCLRVRAAGYRVVYDPRPTVHHFYGSPGGNENRHLHGRQPDSHRWYRDFFHNHVYVSLTHMPLASLGPLLWRLYRGHVLNGPYAREGVAFLARRHRALLAGALGGYLSYRRARRERAGAR